MIKKQQRVKRRKTAFFRGEAFRWPPLIMIVGLSVMIGSCAGDAPTATVEEDLGSPIDQAVDQPPLTEPVKDSRPKEPDQFIWPDTNQPVLDTWPDATDTYAATPFGCETDADCFGKLCCDTPWGVKLCADECDPLPDP